MNTKTKHRGLFLHFWTDLGTNPMLLGLLRRLVDNGYEIDACLQTNDSFPFPEFKDGSVHVCEVEDWRNCSCEIREFIGRHGQEVPYDWVMAVDSQGLFAVRPILPELGAPLIYVSCELIFMDELRRQEDILLKEVECTLTRQARIVIIQDEWRGQLLAEENGLDLSRFVYLPNSPSDIAPSQNCRYLHRKLRIPEDKKIILHAGSFDEWTCGEELIRAAHEFPDDFVLVVHCRKNLNANDFICRFLGRVNPVKVYFSVDALPLEDCWQLFASCAAALAVYKTIPGCKYTQKNLTNLGFSSGKFAYAACMAKPIISNMDCYKTIFRKYENGQWIDSIQAFPAALSEMRDRMIEMGINNRRFFEASLAFDLNVNKVIDKIKSCERSSERG